jgi:hypothetical protein
MTDKKDMITVQVVMSRKWLLDDIDGKGKALAVMTNKTNGSVVNHTTETLFHCPVCEQNGKNVLMKIKDLCVHLNDHCSELWEQEHPATAPTLIPVPQANNAREFVMTPQGKQVTKDNICRTIFEAERLAIMESAQEVLGKTDDELLAIAMAESMCETIANTNAAQSTIVQTLRIGERICDELQQMKQEVDRPVVTRAPNIIIEHVTRGNRVPVNSCSLSSHDSFEAD